MGAIYQVQRSPRRAARVLLVDGNRNQRRALAIGLRVTGCVAIEAESAREALSLSDTEDFDMVVVEQLLPDRRGSELLVELRRRLPAARLLLTCADEVGPNIPELREVEAPILVPKPLRTEDLLGFLESLCACA